MSSQYQHQFAQSRTLGAVAGAAAGAAYAGPVQGGIAPGGGTYRPGATYSAVDTPPEATARRAATAELTQQTSAGTGVSQIAGSAKGSSSNELGSLVDSALTPTTPAATASSRSSTAGLNSSLRTTGSASAHSTGALASPKGVATPGYAAHTAHSRDRDHPSASSPMPTASGAGAAGAALGASGSRRAGLMSTPTTLSQSARSPYSTAASGSGAMAGAGAGAGAGADAALTGFVERGERRGIPVARISLETSNLKKLEAALH